MLMTMVSAIIYLLMAAGILLLLKQRAESAIDLFLSRRRLRDARRPTSEQTMGRLISHLEAVLSEKNPLTPTAFLVMMIVLFFTVFIVSAKTLAYGPALVTGLAFAGLPYLFLRMRLERQRRAGSFEGEKLVSAFLAHYLVTGGNIYETIARVRAVCPHLKVTGTLLGALLMKLRNTGDPARVRTATDAFSYGIGTSWSAMLAYAIRTAAVKGTDVTPVLEDILAQLCEARALAEERKRINGESVRMAAYLTPGLYIGSVFVSLFIMGITPAAFLYNQFFSGPGFALFTAFLFLFLLNRILLETLTNRKLDF
ncbi:hypothetical protein AGMMS49983_08140 [Clostridia bacterium]|nr:hypothetical protein AGMMS49983_08140 [Clostridia bacterium]